MEIKRGNIHYIEIPQPIGHEMMKDRPAVVVSCDPLNQVGAVVSVVYLTGSPQPERPYHVCVKSTQSARHGYSTALCEHIYTVDKMRVGKLLARCTEEEMEAIDNGILMTLALGDGKYKGPGKQPPAPLARPKDEPEHITPGRIIMGTPEPSAALIRAETERDTYKALYERLLDSMTMERRIGA